MKPNRSKKTALSLVLQLLLWSIPVNESMAGEPQSTKLTKETVEALIFKKDTQGVSSRDGIPKAFWDAMNLENIADPKESFSAGCAGMAKHTRMIAAGLAGNSAILMYEQGGIAYFRRLQVYEKHGNQVQCVYNEIISNDELIEKIRKRLSK